MAVVLQVRVGQARDQDGVVALERRAEQHRPRPADARVEAAQVARAAVEDPLLPEPDRLHVAVAVENGKRVAVLQDPSSIVGQP